MYSFLESLSKGKRLVGMKAKDHWIIWQRWRFKQRSFHGKFWHYWWWFPHALKGEESASSVDNKRGNTDGGGTFLLGPKKTIGVMSGGTNEKASSLPPKGSLARFYHCC
jgi:hypothetical protein